MPSRDFVDSTGADWRVWSTVPMMGAVLTPGFEGGWLTFESGAGALRRLAPIPEDWDSVPAERLELYCRAAKEVPRHTGPLKRVNRPEDETRPDDGA
jgi:hypothetical protein